MSKYFYFAIFFVLGLLILQRFVVIKLVSNVLKEPFMNCPESYNKVVNDIQKNYVDQLRAYTPNDYIYITENITENLPIPVNMNFLNNKF